VKKQSNYWANDETRRDFLAEIARKHGADPLLPETWYNFRREIILHEKVRGKGGGGGGKFSFSQFGILACSAIGHGKFPKCVSNYLPRDRAQGKSQGSRTSISLR
jgi:hypothetical protein